MPGLSLIYLTREWILQPYKFISGGERPVFCTLTELQPQFHVMLPDSPMLPLLMLNLKYAQTFLTTTLAL
jgi:hypothetical protein